MNMEIDITTFVSEIDTWGFSGSIATHGANAGPDTWGNALAEADQAPLLTSGKQLQALRDHVEAMGFGEDVQSYGAKECNALFIQLIAGDMRESGMDGIDVADFDWEAYEAECQEGSISGNIFKGDDGKIYYSLSH